MRVLIHVCYFHVAVCFCSNPMHTQFTSNVHISTRPLCVQLLYIVYTRFKHHSNYVHQLVNLNIMTTLS